VKVKLIIILEEFIHKLS